MSNQRRQWQPTPVLLPGKSHGWRSLVGYSPWGREELDTTERLHFHFSLSCIGDGNGNPLQCSCLENPRDRGAWWAAIYGAAQSWTQLKWLCSSSMSKTIFWFVVRLLRNWSTEEMNKSDHEQIIDYRNISKSDTLMWRGPVQTTRHKDFEEEINVPQYLLGE